MSLRLSRLQGGDPYISAVFTAGCELVKLYCSMGLLFFTGEKDMYLDRVAAPPGPREAGGAFGRAVDVLTYGVLASGPMVVPAVVYALQNTLNVAASSYLPAHVLQGAQNTKIVMSGVFATVLLRRPPTRTQWLSLCGLVAGITLVSVGDPSRPASAAAGAGGYTLGLGMVGVASVCSGFAGAWTEMYLKKEGTGIWMRNMQLAMGGAVVSFAGGLATQGREISQRGVLAGFNGWTWTGLLLNALGGFLSSVLMKFADSGSVLKNQAPAAGLLITLVLAVPLFGRAPAGTQWLGAAVIAAALWGYQKGMPPPGGGAGAGKPPGLPVRSSGEEDALVGTPPRPLR